jgi:hypothetical protein
VDSRLRRSPPDRASAVPYGQAGENALRFPHLAHRSAAAHKLHSTIATTRYEFDSGKSETISRLPALAYSPRKLSKRPGPSQIALTEELKRLSPEAPESFRNHLLGDLGRLPFDIFISKLVPAPSAGSSDQIIIGFRLISARNDVSCVTA